VLVASSVPSTQGIERRPEIALCTIRLLAVPAERIEPGTELCHTGEKVGERLPERSEETLVSGNMSLLSGESRQGDEEENKEDDGGARPHCMRHVRTSLPGDVRSDPGRG